MITIDTRSFPLHHFDYNFLCIIYLSIAVIVIYVQFMQCLCKDEMFNVSSEKLSNQHRLFITALSRHELCPSTKFQATVSEQH